MQLNRCPVCHARMSIEMMISDESGRDLMGLLVKLDTESGAALVGYLSLFRSDQRDLANDKALRLANEALALGPLLAVSAAMRKTVENLRVQCSQRLTNHNYLKKVLADTLLCHISDNDRGEIKDYLDQLTIHSKPIKASSKTGQALQSLEAFGNE
ncbi:MAG: hypothetical protein WCG16_13090 [Methylococcales bacterium]